MRRRGAFGSGSDDLPVTVTEGGLEVTEATSGGRSTEALARRTDQPDQSVSWCLRATFGPRDPTRNGRCTHTHTVMPVTLDSAPRPLGAERCGAV